MIPGAVGTAVIGFLGMSLFLMGDIIGLARAPVSLIVTISLLVAVVGFLPIVVQWCLEFRLVFRVRNFLRRGGAICFECGYRVDNVGPTSEQCPECGYSIEESKVRTEKWVANNLPMFCFCFWPFTLLEPREDDEGEPPM